MERIVEIKIEESGYSHTLKLEDVSGIFEDDVLECERLGKYKVNVLKSEKVKERKHYKK